MSAGMYIYMNQAGEFRQIRNAKIEFSLYTTLSPTFVGFFVCGMIGRFGDDMDQKNVIRWIYC